MGIAWIVSRARCGVAAVTQANHQEPDSLLHYFGAGFLADGVLGAGVLAAGIFAAAVSFAATESFASAATTLAESATRRISIAASSARCIPNMLICA